MAVKIYAVLKNSPSGKKGIRPGDMLVSINGHEITDVLDYRFYSDDNMTVEFLTKDSVKVTVRIKNAKGFDKLGLAFETYLMDKHRHCKNACIFCFIDQLPKGLRKSLYFKDDDTRLSFLFGNYITLTNLSEKDVDRIIKMHISPINASVHTMNPELRVKMMKNPNAGKVLGYLRRFSDAGITINAQLVLCPGINDGDELKYSLDRLSELENVKSIAAVPVGLTRYRENLYPLKPFDKESAGCVIDIIDDFNAVRKMNGKEKLAYPSDEFFQLACRDIPEYSYYGDFPQLDNGVGLISSMRHEFLDELNNAQADEKIRKFSLATGVAAYDLLKLLADEFCKKFTNSEINVYCVKNEFFGETVTVAGLVTGKDLINSLKKQNFSDKCLMLPSVMLKGADEPVFIDDISVDDVCRELNTEVVVTSCDANSLFDTFYNSYE